MTRTRVLVLTAVLLLAAGAPLGSTGAAAQADCGFPFSSTDATGTSVTVEEEPERVVTLNPSAAQTMWEIGAQEKVVGLSGFASYLDGADERTNVYPTGSAVNVEQVVALEPDLVLAPNTIFNDTVAQLRNAGVTVYKFEAAGSIEDVYGKTELTGRLVGECEAAEGRVDRMQEDVETIREATEDVDRPLVLYLLTDTGWTAGEGTFIHEIIETAGGRNLASEAGISGYQKISDEVVLTENPDWIVLNSDIPAVPNTSAYQQTEAVTEGNVLVVNANYVSEPAPRIVQVMETLVRAFHPEAYEAALGEGEGGSGDGGGVEVSAPGDNPIPTATETPTPETTTTEGDATTTARATSTEASASATNASADSAASSTETATATVTTTEPTTSTEATATDAGAGDGATTDTATPTETATEVETVQEPGGLPGFGIGVALLAIALVAAGMLARRRQ